MSAAYSASKAPSSLAMPSPLGICICFYMLGATCALADLSAASGTTERRRCNVSRPYDGPVCGHVSGSGDPSASAGYCGEASALGVDVLYADGANASSRDAVCNSPLHVAAYNGRLSEVHVLVRAGAEIDAHNCKGETPMHQAARAGQSEVLQALLAARGDPCATDAEGATPLHAAAAKARVEVVGVLLAPELSELPTVESRPLKDLNLLRCGVLDAADVRGDRALHLAAASSSGAPFVLALVSRGADRGAQNGRGETPLHLAAAHGHAAAIGMLLA